VLRGRGRAAYQSRRVWAGRPNDRFDARLYRVAGQVGAIADAGLVPDPVQVRPDVLDVTKSVSAILA
jgi:hypothetical protein